ncbi:hypothetical protein E3N88_18678 [Mikania micrantha]|uniref:Uncharacterized protein n=1 Tax=Mikania micrantha TaxID=192012 RepID=A0A5N6NL76_9ASTR|nr:hypothetical protein E3N88_18678 [Mikania micrantha]
MVNGVVSKIRVLNEGDDDDCKRKSRIKVLRSPLLARPPVMLPWLEEGLPLVAVLTAPNHLKDVGISTNPPPANNVPSPSFGPYTLTLQFLWPLLPPQDSSSSAHPATTQQLLVVKHQVPNQQQPSSPSLLPCTNSKAPKIQQPQPETNLQQSSDQEAHNQQQQSTNLEETDAATAQLPSLLAEGMDSST